MSIQTVIPLLNATTAVPLDFGEGLSIRVAASDEKKRWSEDQHVRDVVPHRVFPCIESVLVLNDMGGQAERVGTLLMAWFGIASLLTNRDIQAAFCEQWVVTSGHPAVMMHNSVQHFPLSLPVSAAPPWQGPVQLSLHHKSIVLSLRRFRSGSETARLFHFALSRWFYAQNVQRRTAEDSVLDLAIALEALFIRRHEKVPLAKAMRERIATFYHPERRGKTFKEMREEVLEAYDVRSAIAHGDVVDEDRLDRAQRFMNSALREILLEFARGELEGFDPTKLWAPTAPKRLRLLGTSHVSRVLKRLN